MLILPLEFREEQKPVHKIIEFQTLGGDYIKLGDLEAGQNIRLALRTHHV